MTAQEILNQAISEAQATIATETAAQAAAEEISQAAAAAKEPLTDEQALGLAEALSSLQPHKDSVVKECKEYEEQLKSYVAENRKKLLQNGAKSYTFPGTNVQVVLSETTSTKIENPELFNSEYEEAFILANPANEGAFTHSIDHKKLQNDEKTNALKTKLGLTTVVKERWAVVMSKSKKVRG